MTDIIKSILEKTVRFVGGAEPVVFSNMTFPRVARFEGVVFKNVRFEQVDFDGSIFSGCVFDDCLFDNSDLSSVSLEDKSRLVHCQFHHCDMRGMVFGSGVFSAVEFKRCDFRGTWFGEATHLWKVTSEHTMNDCRFISCNIQDTLFDARRVSSLSIRSALKEVTFIGEGFNDKPTIDLTGAKFNGVFFKNLDTGNIKIAQSEEIVFVDNIGAKAEKAMKNLDFIEDAETRKIMGRRMKQYLGYPNMIFDKKYLCKYDVGTEFWDLYFKLIESGR